MQCQIQWIDDNGKPTPDDNDAIMMAHSHKPKWLLSSGGPGNKQVGYEEEIQQSFPICEKHYASVSPNMRYPRGMWEFSLISDS